MHVLSHALRAQQIPRGCRLQARLDVARGGVVLVVLEAVQVFVPLATHFAPERFVLFHAKRAGIGAQSLRVDDGECAVIVGGELLRIVTVLGEESVRVISG